ncbi:MAG TPA: TetR/AcrR family transcriptional regulator [Candidatus Scatomorpha gallistercoris]|nr:TetR/AcrR family transcriptional regulator [Candidatus Scatomorpha gallistercoris]
MRKQDRRYEYTEGRIREAARALVCESGTTDRLTVSGICRRAEINRGTFYLHYEDINALLDALGEELYRELSGEFDGMFSSEAKLFDGFVRLLTTISGDGYAAAMLSCERVRLLDRFSESSREAVIENWLSRSELTRAEAELVYAFVSCGSIGATRLLCSGNGPQNAYSLLFRLVSRGLTAAVQSLDA